MFHTITKRLEIYIDINIEISKVDHYFTSTFFRLALEITFLLNKYFFLQMAYKLLSQNRKVNKEVDPNKSKGVRNFFWKKIRGGMLIRDLRVFSQKALS